ncbi:MAG: type II toxin-antitoxin system HicB family antitoxin [Chloroflexota bacterium]|nr:type II toxin-antitoxin system HicB family antitoxin [Chloroflexota bacterium]
MARYTVVIDAEPDGSAYNVSVPALPGCYTWGETFEEAVRMAREAIAGHVAALRDLGEEVPVEGGSAPIVTVVDVDLPAAQAGPFAPR